MYVQSVLILLYALKDNLLLFALNTFVVKRVDATTSKATKALMMCKRPSGKSRRCSTKTLRWLHTMIVQLIVTYVAVAWVSRTNLPR